MHIRNAAPDDLFTLRELAAAIGVTPDSLRQRVARKTLKAHKFGRDWLVTHDEFTRIVAASGRRTTTTTGATNGNESE